MTRRLKRNNGFTLIELMISIMIMTISGAALYYMFMQGQVMTQEEDHRRLAYQLVQKRMVKYKLLSDQKIVELGTFTGEEYLIEPTDEDDDEGGISANYTVEVEEEDGLYRVSIEYEWVELSGLDNRVQMVNYFLAKPVGE